MLKRTSYSTPAVRVKKLKSECRVGRRKARAEGLTRKLGWIAHLVQILVVVANIQSENIED